MLRTVVSLVAAIVLAVLSFTVAPSSGETKVILCNGKCSTFCSSHYNLRCWELKCCDTDEGGCLVGDPKIFSVWCLGMLHP